MSVAAIHTHGMPIWIHKPSVRLLLGGSVASFFAAAASVGVNPADQRWGFWPLLPLSYQLQAKV